MSLVQMRKEEGMEKSRDGKPEAKKTEGRKQVKAVKEWGYTETDRKGKERLE